jgi:PAS domain S-box-containing protein
MAEEQPNKGEDTEPRAGIGLLLQACEGLSETVVIWDADDRLAYCNASFREINVPNQSASQPGVRFEDHIRGGLEAGLYPDAVGCEEDWLADRMERHRNPGAPFEQQRQDGRWILIREEPVAGGGTIVIGTDITERKAAEARRLEESRARFRDFAGAAADWLWEMDANLRFTYMSENVERITGVPPEWHYGKTRRELLGDDYDRETWDEHLARLERHEPFRDFVFRRVGEGIETKWLSSSGAPLFDDDGRFIGYRGVGSDVTATMEHQRALAEREAHLRLLTDALPVMIAYVGADGHFKLVNRTCEAWFAKPRDEIVGQPVDAFFTPGSPDLSDKIARVLAGEHVVFESEMRFPDGEARDVRIVLAPRVVESGAVDGYFALVQDISGDRAMEEQLRQAQKMEAVGQLTGGVAHDFNNLLTAIVGNLEMLRSETVSDADREMMIEQALLAADRGSDLVRHLLAFSRRQSLNPELLDVKVIIEDSVKLFKRTLGENIEIANELTSDTAKVLVDPSQLQSALLNLAINARDAMPNGGTLTLRTETVALDDDMPGFAEEVRAGRYTRITVADTGIGIAPAMLDRVFDPFFTTKAAGHGTGLGLSMVYGFVRQSRGHVTIHSVPGEGTTVSIYLPHASPDAAAASAERSAGKATAAGGGAHILIVEDEELVRDYVGAALELLGFRASIFADGPEALEKLDTLQDVDLLLCDVVLPKGMNGPQVAEQVLQRFPHIPVLFMSGYSEEAIVGQWARRDGIHLMSKPFTPAELAGRIVALLGT